MRIPPMRITASLTAISLLLSAAVWGQEQVSTGTGHFEGWLSGVRWGAEKQTFEAAFGIRHVAATFSVAENAFGWRISFSNMEETFNAWEDVTAWCWGPGTVAFRTGQQAPPRAVHDLGPEDLVTIVDGYFKRYASEAEWSAPDWECTPGALRRPHPADTARIIELLEAALEAR